MKKLLAIAFAAMFSIVSIAPVFAAEKKQVDCSNAKYKNHKDCKKK